MKFFDDLFTIENKNNYAISGLTKELNATYIYNTFKERNMGVLLVVSSTYEANDLYNRLINYTDKVLFFPMDDFITSEAIAISPEFKTERINTLNKLIYDDKYIVITNLMGILRYLPTREMWLSKVIALEKDSDIDREELINKLYNLGYEKETIVTETGKFAIRGYVIDIFPVGMDNPIRIELWGDTIDSIKEFNTEDQLTTSNLDSVCVYPYSEFLIDNYSEDIVNKQKYLKHYSNSVSFIGNYFTNYICFWYDYNQIDISYNLLRETIFEYDRENVSNFKTDYMFDLKELNINNEIYIMGIDNMLSNIKLDGEEKYVSYNIDNFEGNLDLFKKELDKYIRRNKTVILCISNSATAKRIVNYLELDN